MVNKIVVTFLFLELQQHDSLQYQQLPLVSSFHLHGYAQVSLTWLLKNVFDFRGKDLEGVGGGGRAWVMFGSGESRGGASLVRLVRFTHLNPFFSLLTSACGLCLYINFAFRSNDTKAGSDVILGDILIFCSQVH